MVNFGGPLKCQNSISDSYRPGLRAKRVMEKVSDFSGGCISSSLVRLRCGPFFMSVVKPKIRGLDNTDVVQVFIGVRCFLCRMPFVVRASRRGSLRHRCAAPWQWSAVSGARAVARIRSPPFLGIGMSGVDGLPLAVVLLIDLLCSVAPQNCCGPDVPHFHCFP